jgi:hypothetical protein
VVFDDRSAEPTPVAHDRVVAVFVRDSRAGSKHL